MIDGEGSAEYKRGYLQGWDEGYDCGRAWLRQLGRDAEQREIVAGRMQVRASLPMFYGKDVLGQAPLSVARVKRETKDRTTSQAQEDRDG